ncbi:MAG TPA: lipid-A-disaccharide synthase [Pyrinomonadaceae bacterium]|nr:lipid-A-disaccharide synthase [Pyrinomonadaceae bacterium]
MENHQIMIVVGEASGDAHAAKLVKRLREISPELKFFGSTGVKMREEGVETIVKADDLSIVGLLEIGRALPMFWNTFQKLKKSAIERKPDAVILVDFPDFNMKMAKSLKKQGIKVIYYISPQLWAWRKYRIKTIKNSVDLLLTILPFEKDWYHKEGIDHVEYVGNPLAGEIKVEKSKAEFCQKYGLDETKPIIALLAGSRHKEITRILPLMLETANFMSKQNNDLQFVVAMASNRRMAEFEKAKNIVGEFPKSLIVVQNETWEALKASNVAAVTSGTATLETAIIGTPMAIVYKTSSLNFKLLRPLIDVPHFGLINLIAQERLAKELIQDDFTQETLATELLYLLEDNVNAKVRKRLQEVSETLGHGGTAKRAAEAIMKLLLTN